MKYQDPDIKITHYEPRNIFISLLGLIMSLIYTVWLLLSLQALKLYLWVMRYWSRVLLLLVALFTAVLFVVGMIHIYHESVKLLK